MAVVNLKGGSGKSTLAVQLALHWAKRQTLALADIDPQASSALVLDQRHPAVEVVRSTGPKLPMLKSTLARRGLDGLVVDTPASMKADVAAAISAADLALLVVRPTYLDIAAAAATAQMVRQLRIPAIVVLNQAPPARSGAESGMVLKAREALALLRLPIADTVIRSRAVFSRALELGRAVADLEPASPAAAEIETLAVEVDQALPASSARQTAQRAFA